MLGLFLVARTTRATPGGAAIATIIGSATILWMTLTAYRGPASAAPDVATALQSFRNPLHPLMTGVVGAALIWVIGALLGRGSSTRELARVD
jgi:hypothetical protein